MTSTDSIPITDLATTVPASSTTTTELTQDGSPPSTAATTSNQETTERVTTHVLPPPFTTSTPQPVLLTQGAEALVYKTIFLDASTPAALKYRPSKPYRHPTLDARLTKQRVLAEARVLVRLSGLKRDGISVPAVLGLEWDVARKVKGLDGETKQRAREGGAGAVGASSGTAAAAGAWLLMEWVEGKSVKELLRDWDVWWKESGRRETEDVQRKAEGEVKKLLGRIGTAVAAMHEKGGVIHGDLTSSNIMVRPARVGRHDLVSGGDAENSATSPPSSSSHNDCPDLDGEIVLIDFGLATQSIQEEDRAVDLYVLERAFGSTHPRQEHWFDDEVLQSQEGYRGGFKGASGILKRLEEVRLRGRKRTMVG